jgi:hypothetical protein
MSDRSAIRPLSKPTSTRWVWTLRVVTLISTVVLSVPLLVSIYQDSYPPLRVISGFPALLYVWILFRLSGNTQKGVRLAVTAGSAAFVVGLVTVGTMLADRCGFDLLPMVIAGLLVPFQVALILAAIKIADGLNLQINGRPGFRARLFRRTLSGSLPLALLGSVAVPNLIHSSRMGTAGVATPPANLRLINTAEMSYAEKYKRGFSPSLGALAPPSTNEEASSSSAALIDNVLASGVKAWYRYDYKPGPVTNGLIQSYTVGARPVRFGCGGEASFFTDQSGVIRSTQENRPPDGQDPPLGD